MHLSVSDATKICVLPASLQSFPNGAPLQTTHPCGALSVPQIHHNAFDKTPVTLFKKNKKIKKKNLNECLSCTCLTHISFLARKWKGISAVWAIPSHVKCSDLSTITMETLYHTHRADFDLCVAVPFSLCESISLTHMKVFVGCILLWSEELIAVADRKHVSAL